MKKTEKWPRAAWGAKGKRYTANVSYYPVERDEVSLIDYLLFPCKPLSYKAAKGFEKRLNTGSVRCPQFFKEAIQKYVKQRGDENG